MYIVPTDYAFSTVTDATRFRLQEVAIGGGVNEYGPFELGVTYGARSLPANVEMIKRVWLPLVVRDW